MCYRRLLCLALMALSYAPAAAQEALIYQQVRLLLASRGETNFLTTPSSFAFPDRPSADLTDRGSSFTAPATFDTGGASLRQLSIGTFFSPERRQQLLGDVGERERAGREEMEQQQSSASSPSEAVATPGTQLQTYLPEGQRPFLGPGRRISALRSKAGNAKTDFIGVPAQRVAIEMGASSLENPILWLNEKLAEHAATTRSAVLQGSEDGFANASSARAAGQGDAANAVHSGGSAVNRLGRAELAIPGEGRAHSQTSFTVLSSRDRREGHLNAISGSSQPSAGSIPERGNRNGEQQEHAVTQNGTSIGPVTAVLEDLPQAAIDQAWTKVENVHTEKWTPASHSSSFARFSPDTPEKEHGTTGDLAANEAARQVSVDFNDMNPHLVAGVYDAFAAASGALATSRRMGASDFLPTASASLVSPVSPDPSSVATESKGWWPFARGSSSTREEKDSAFAAGTRETSSKPSTRREVAVADVESTAMEEVKKGAGTARGVAHADMSGQTGPFLSALWSFTDSKRENKKAAAKAALDAALSNLTAKQSAAAALVIPAAYAGATARTPSEADVSASEAQRVDLSSLTSRLFPQWLVPNRSSQKATDEAVSHETATARTPQEFRSWWLPKSRAHEAMEQQPPHVNDTITSGWWSNAGATATDMRDVASTAKEILGTNESAEKAKGPSGPLSTLWWLFTSSKQEKKNVAAKAAVKAALSWIADTQKHMQATLKTLLPAPALQNTAQAADDANALGLPLSRKPTDALSANKSGFFHLEDVLQRLRAGEQQLSMFTEEQAKNWYDTMQQQVKQQGLDAALAGWLYAGSSDNSAQQSGTSTHYGQSTQQIGTPSVSPPFFHGSFWSNTARGDASQQQQQREQQTQPLQPTSPPWGPLHWLNNLFTRGGEAYGKPHTFVSEEKRGQLEGVKAPNRTYSWASWIGGGHQKAPETETSDLIRKAATASVLNSEGERLSESGSTIFPVSNAVDWMLPAKRASNISNKDKITLSPRNDYSVVESASDNLKQWPADVGDGGSLAPKNLAFSLQSALLGGIKEETTQANKDSIRAPGLKPGVYWWEWQAYPSDETSEKTTQPTYMRHIHLDCDPVLPFQACIRDCQKESARSLLKSSSHKKAEKPEGTTESIAPADMQRQEPLALGSYEFGILRGCYLNCKQNWLDRDLPGCLRADGVKVEGTPPAAAYRSTTTSTTTTTTRTPTASVAASETDVSSTLQNQGFWSRLRPTKSESGSDANDLGKEEGDTVNDNCTTNVL